MDAGRCGGLLDRMGVHASVSSIGRLMKLADMTGLVRGRRIITTRKSIPTAGDLVGRQFTADGPNLVWVTDMTYVRTWSGWVYVGFMIDVYARRIIACHGSCEATAVFVSTILTLALDARRREHHPVTPGLIHHSDHGSQYTSIRYGEQLAINQIVPSFGTIGDSYDNALAETINGQYKAECVNQDGPFATLTDVMDATLAWVTWWNNQRLHEYLGYRTPIEAETQYYSHQMPLEHQ